MGPGDSVDDYDGKDRHTIIVNEVVHNMPQEWPRHTGPYAGPEK
jgi:hypothetical protein